MADPPSAIFFLRLRLRGNDGRVGFRPRGRGARLALVLLLSRVFGTEFLSYAKRTVRAGDEVEYVAVVPPRTSPGGERRAAHTLVAGDAPPDDVDARVVRGASRLRVPGRGRPALAVGLVLD